MSSSLSPYRILVFIGLLCVICFAVLLMLHRCVCNGRRRRRRRQQGQQGQEVEEMSYSVGMSSSSRVHLVKGAAPPAVVCPYRKSEAWTESTCPVCLADFADGEAVRVLPECMHYFHAECIDTWLRGSTSCPMCRAETTPTPSPGDLHHNLSVSFEEILVHT